MTGLVDRLERELDAARTARPRDSVGYVAALERALRACNADWEIAWPPGRNQPCWCGSGRKYKKCCAAPTSVDAEPHR